MEGKVHFCSWMGQKHRNRFCRRLDRANSVRLCSLTSNGDKIPLIRMCLPCVPFKLAAIWQEFQVAFLISDEQHSEFAESFRRTFINLFLSCILILNRFFTSKIQTLCYSPVHISYSDHPCQTVPVI